jgi:hypothetical protein
LTGLQAISNAINVVSRQIQSIFSRPYHDWVEYFDASRAAFEIRNQGTSAESLQMCLNSHANDDLTKLHDASIDEIWLWTNFDQSITALDPPTRKRLAEEDLEHGHHQHTEASRTDLEHARATARKQRLRAPALEIVQRTKQIQEHLLRRASDGLPLSLKYFYESYRSSVGATSKEMASTRLRFQVIVKRI